MKNIRTIFFAISTLIVGSLACGTIQVGVVTPTSESDSNDVVQIQDPNPEVVLVNTNQPTSEPEEDFSHLWVEYWNPIHNYGIAIPAHWTIETDSKGGYMFARSYDLDYFQANSIKGNWISGAPEGAVKLDFVPFEGIVPEQSLSTAISNILGANPEMEVVLSVEKLTIGDFDAVMTTTARPDSLEDTTTNVAIRLSPEVILFVAAYPNSGHNLRDVKTVLNSLVLDKSTPITKPSTAPQPPFTVDSEISGSPTYAYVTAAYGHIASLAEGEKYDDKVVLYPLGIGEFGIKGFTSEIEAEIVALRDASGPGEFVHLWGVLYCNVSDYNTCQLAVERVEYGDQYTVAVSAVDRWVGTIKRTTFNGEPAYVFELAEGAALQYGISANNDQMIQGQIEALGDSGTIVSVWGDLLVGVQDINGTRIEVQRLDPPGPGVLPSSADCSSESGYLESAEEMLEFIQNNLETGNYWPFSYAIGNPFVIGYWLSEGISLPREQALVQLERDYLPPPDEVINISDPALFPDIVGMGGPPLAMMWGPDVDVAANLYSKGWGPDGQGEAILSIARCDYHGYDVYYWYGMLYAGGGFE